MQNHNIQNISESSSPLGRLGGASFILPTSYFGPVQWYRQLCRCMGSCICIDDSESYQKQTFRNRCTIATANGPLNLTVPVAHKGVRCIRDIEISDHGNWRHLHWQALLTNYGESAFFEYYQDDIRPFYERRWKYLYDYNQEIMQTMCRLLDVEIEIKHLSQSNNSEQELITPPWDSQWAVPYYQVFRQRHGFLPNLSILDLLFNEGPQSILHLVDRT